MKCIKDMKCPLYTPWMAGMESRNSDTKPGSHQVWVHLNYVWLKTYFSMKQETYCHFLFVLLWSSLDFHSFVSLLDDIAECTPNSFWGLLAGIWHQIIELHAVSELSSYERVISFYFFGLYIPMPLTLGERDYDLERCWRECCLAVKIESCILGMDKKASWRPPCLTLSWKFIIIPVSSVIQ